MIETYTRFILFELFPDPLVIDFLGFHAAQDETVPQRLLIKRFGLSEGLSR